MTELTHRRLVSLLRYEPDTGRFFWLVARGRARVGAEAGFEHGEGYRLVRIDGVAYLAHRLAWFYTHNAWPAHQIDHKNRRRSDNRIENLRDVLPRMNQQNMKLRSDSVSGFTGVSKKRSRWRAQITVKGRYLSLGSYDTPEEAHAAYLTAKAEHHDIGRTA